MLWDAALNIILKLTFALTPIIPGPVLYSGAGLLARFLHRLLPKYRKTVLSHLEMVFGNEKTRHEIEAVALGVYRHSLLNVLDFARTARMTNEQLKKEISFTGAQHLRDAIAEGNGVVLFSAHYGSFLTSAGRIAAEGFPLTIVYRRQRRASKSEEYLRHLWTKRGITMLPRGKGEKGVYEKLLRGGGVFTTAVDQNAFLKGIPVPFLGLPASTFHGWMAIAMKTGAAVIPAFCIRNPDDSNRVEIGPRLELSDTGDYDTDLYTNVARANAIIETRIRRSPEQWLWFHRRWKVKRPEDLPKDRGAGCEV